MRPFLLALFILSTAALSARATIHIVAAENFYGTVAQQIGGNRVEVTSILSNPDQDPHLFTVDASTAKAIEQADIVVISGIDYDPWMTDLVTAHPNPKRIVITVADLIGAKTGDNPHIWYRPGTMGKYAMKLNEVLSKQDPDHAKEYAYREVDFLSTIKQMLEDLGNLPGRYTGGADALATEPVFGYMADALGLKMHGLGFQNHVMNNVEPTAKETAEFEDMLRNHKVKLLIYNSQATDPIADRMKELAKSSGIPVVGVTETEPAGTTYSSWMYSQIHAVEKACGK